MSELMRRKQESETGVKCDEELAAKSSQIKWLEQQLEACQQLVLTLTDQNKQLSEALQTKTGNEAAQLETMHLQIQKLNQNMDASLRSEKELREHNRKLEELVHQKE